MLYFFLIPKQIYAVQAAHSQVTKLFVFVRQTAEQEIMDLSHSRNICLQLCTKQAVVHVLYCAKKSGANYAVFSFLQNIYLQQ